MKYWRQSLCRQWSFKYRYPVGHVWLISRSKSREVISTGNYASRPGLWAELSEIGGGGGGGGVDPKRRLSEVSTSPNPRQRADFAMTRVFLGNALDAGSTWGQRSRSSCSNAAPVTHRYELSHTRLARHTGLLPPCTFRHSRLISHRKLLGSDGNIAPRFREFMDRDEEANCAPLSWLSRYLVRVMSGFSGYFLVDIQRRLSSN